MWFLSESAKNNYMSMVLYGFLLIFLVLILFVVVIWMRKKTLGGDNDKPGGGFLLSDLRKMRDEGKMTDEEFEKAKAAIIGLAGKKEKEAPKEGPKNGRVG